MSVVEQFIDLGESTTTADPGTAGTSLAMTSRSSFPQTAPFWIVVQNSETDKTNREVMHVTGGAGTGAGSFTVTRSSTPFAHAIGSYVAMVPAAGALSSLRDRTPFVNLALDYGVSPSASAAANTTAIQQAFTDVTTAGKPTTGKAVYLPGAARPYPVNTLTLPSEPLTLFGDGPMVSVLSTTSGTILTYSPTTAPLSGTGDPWSINSTDLGGAGAAVHYKLKAWQIHDIGFTKSDNWSVNTGTGLDFPNWSVSNGIVLWMNNVIISNFNGTGISCLISGCRQECVFMNVLSDGNAHEGVIYGSDQWWIGCHSNNNGQEGFWCDGRNGQLIGCKAYSNGTLAGTSRNAGFYVQGSSGPIIGCHAQDNYGPGLQLHIVKGAHVGQFFAERNCWNGGTLDTAKQAGVLIEDCTYCQIDGLRATDSYSGAKTNIQTHALRVTNTGGNTNVGNRVSLVQYFTVQTLGSIVDTASDLNGTTVITGGNGAAKSANTTRTTNAVLAADPDLQFVMDANAKYRIRGKIFFDTTSAADFQYDFSAPASPTLVRGKRSHNIAGGTPAELLIDVANPTSPIALAGTGTTGGFIEFDFIWHNGATAGTWAFRWAQGTSNGGNTTVLAGSYIEVSVV